MLYARWDLSQVAVVDHVTKAVLARIFPLDKEKNAEGKRRMRGLDKAASDLPTSQGMSPLLEEMLSDARASGLPPGYLPKPEPSAVHDEDDDCDAAGVAS